MIELKHDQLHISFPAVADQIRQLLADYESRVLPRILSEDRSAALKAYQSGRFRNAELDGPANAARLARLTDDGIREVFRSKLDRKSRTDVSCQLDFQRTLRLPDDGKTYFLPPGRGCFPLRHVDDHAEGVPSSWMERGGVMMPMYQAEALWLNFHGDYPVALKVGAGKINAVSGEEWNNGLHREPQDYVVIPEQPWLDGFSVSKGVIRQFVATPLGDGRTVEEQVTGKGEFGGIQIQAYPMKARLYFDRFVTKSLPKSLSDLLPDLLMEDTGAMMFCDQVLYSAASRVTECDMEMGLGMGGRMQQEIYEDPYGLAAWDLEETSRCFVHLSNALQWREITGANPPQTPVTAKEYEKAGLPWFDYYRDDLAVLEGSKILSGLKSILKIRSETKGNVGLPEKGVTVPAVLSCGPTKRPDQVREWSE